MLGVGLIGAGFMGGMHSNVYANLPDVKLIAVGDLDTRKAKKLARPHRAKAYSDIDALIKNKDIDIVDICLPTFLHPEYTIKAAAAGKSVLCEKPIALTLAEADRMIKATRAAKVKFMVAHCIRFWPEYATFKKLVDSKKYGRVNSIWLSRISPPPTWTWKNWVLNPKQSGGALLDLHIHDVDYLLHLFGTPQAVYCQGVKNSWGWSHVTTTYRYSKVAAVAEGGWDMPTHFPFNMAFRANLEHATVEFSLLQSPALIVYTGNRKNPLAPKVSQPQVESKGPSSGNVAALGGYFNEIEYFTNCVKRNKHPDVVTPAEARESLRVALAEMKSCEAGKVVKL